MLLVLGFLDNFNHGFEFFLLVVRVVVLVLLALGSCEVGTELVPLFSQHVECAFSLGSECVHLFDVALMHCIGLGSHGTDLLLIPMNGILKVIHQPLCAVMLFNFGF